MRNLRITAWSGRKRGPNDMPQDRTVSIEVTSKSRDGCCYFKDGVRSVRLKVAEGAHRVPIFEGAERRNNEYVMNTQVGMLYIIVTDAESPNDAERAKRNPGRQRTTEPEL